MYFLVFHYGFYDKILYAARVEERITKSRILVLRTIRKEEIGRWRKKSKEKNYIESILYINKYDLVIWIRLKCLYCEFITFS
jgi:ferredoxin-fold anticodon binding domain-containing protein